MHGTKHRTIDPACLENPRPEGAESGARRFAIFVSSPDTFSEKWWDTQAFTYTCKYPIPPLQPENLWKTRRKNRKECEKAPEIFVRKSTETIVTRYTHHNRDGAWLVGCCHLIGDLDGSGDSPQSPEQGEWTSLLQTFPITNRPPRHQRIFCPLGFCLFAIASVKFYGTLLGPALCCRGLCGPGSCPRVM